MDVWYQEQSDLEQIYEEVLDLDDIIEIVEAPKPKKSQYIPTFTAAQKKKHPDDWSDIESLAEDCVSEKSVENSEAISISSPRINYNYEIPIFIKATGEAIVKWTEIYLPLQSTIEKYKKSDNVLKVDKNGSVGEYFDYMNRLARYKRELKEFYEEIRDISAEPKRIELLELETKDYEKRYLLKRLRQLNREIDETQNTFKALTKKERIKYNEIKKCDFLKNIAWNGPPTKHKKRETMVVFRRENGIYINSGSLKENKKVPFINNAIDTKAPMLNKAIDIFPKTNGTLRTDDLLIPIKPLTKSTRLPIEMDFYKTPKKNISYPKPFNPEPRMQTSNSLWGEIEGNYKFAQKTNFAINPQLFSQNYTAKQEIYKNVNFLFDKLPWDDLSFYDTQSATHEKINKDFQKMVFDLRFLNYKRTDEASKENKPACDVSDNESDVETAPTESKTEENSTKASEEEHSISEELHHANISYEYPLNKGNWDDAELRDFHRPFIKISASIEIKAILKVPELSYPLKEEPSGYVSFQTHEDLTLKRGAFILTEFVEKRPPLISNNGMTSRITRYFKGQDQMYLESHTGKLGIIKRLSHNQNLPILGHLKDNQSLCLLESKLMKTPLFYHDHKKTDFILIHKKNKWILRPLQYAYTYGQTEPKVKVYTPNSVKLRKFVTQRRQGLILKILKENGNKVSIDTLVSNLPHLPKYSIKKHLKELKCFYTDNFWSSPTLPTKEDIFNKISPEDLCKYESMLSAKKKLKDKGISYLPFDKLFSSIMTLKREVKDKRVNYLADIIEDELLMAPWNLTGSYVQARKRGMIEVLGRGDPTFGNCGYSFLKRILKNSPSKQQIENYQKELNKILRKQIRVLGEAFYQDDSSSDDEEENGQVLRKMEADGLYIPQETYVENEAINEQQALTDLQNTLKSINTSNKEIPVSPPPNSISLPRRKALKITEKIPNLDGTFNVYVKFTDDQELVNKYLINKKNEEMKKLQLEKERAAKTIEEKKKQEKKQIINSLTKELKEKKRLKRKAEMKLEKERKKLEEEKAWKDLCIQKYQSGAVLFNTGHGNMICGRCGMVGHNKQNKKICPLYDPTKEEEKPKRMRKEEVLEVSSTIKINIDELPEPDLTLKKPSKITKKNRPKRTVDSTVFKQKPVTGKRRETWMQGIFQEISSKLIFWDEKKRFLDLEEIENSIDLRKIQEKAKNAEYKNVENFLADIDQLVETVLSIEDLKPKARRLVKEMRKGALKILMSKGLIEQTTIETKESDESEEESETSEEESNVEQSLNIQEDGDMLIINT
ncbi:unnamed protein product [Blepharisma stoltei]|uniref:Uncharacterized protein n=1 Tax=Blepharisma stoltei TaxID=1481888 RepID=A0AAU9J756_9CILI|nr:unnamed protein product [Blepharisma stoltei]